MSAIDILPSYYDVLETSSFDGSSIGVKVHRVDPSNNNQSGLNNTSDIIFSYKGDTKVIRLHPLLTGFRVRAAFRTQARAANADANAAPVNNRHADITLANNWFWHLFDSIKLKVLNQNDLESVYNPGMFMDTISHFMGDEIRKYYGELSGWVPDTGSGEANDKPVIVANAAVAAGGAVPANFVAVAANPNYNQGYRRRKELYNYPVANDNDLRYVEQFFPIFPLSGFLGSDTCIMNTNFDLVLHRKGRGDHLNSIFGAPGTNITFGGDTETGLLSISLELVEQIPEKINKTDDRLMAIFANTKATPKPVSFLQASCESIDISNNSNHVISLTSHRVPRYVFIGLKGKIGPGAADVNQANQVDRADANFSLFAHANIENMIVSINGEEYPSFKQDANFTQNQYSTFYQQYIDVCKCIPYSSCASDGATSALTMKDFKELYPIFAFNCEHQSPKMTTATTNLRVEIKRRLALPANNNDRKNPQYLTAYLIVLEDKYVRLDTVQGKCEVMTNTV